MACLCWQCPEVSVRGEVGKDFLPEVLMLVMMQFKRIEEIEAMPAKTQLDVVGVVEAVDQAGEIPRRDGSTVNKRNLTIKDDSNRSIELTLWDAFAFEPGNEIEQVCTYKEAPLFPRRRSPLPGFSVSPDVGT